MKDLVLNMRIYSYYKDHLCNLNPPHPAPQFTSYKTKHDYLSLSFFLIHHTHHSRVIFFGSGFCFKTLFIHSSKSIPRSSYSNNISPQFASSTFNSNLFLNSSNHLHPIRIYPMCE
ncbi:hypothetical protein QVD17_24756 [Tagetes erecta]|uniref:Uncharacterized protein n=1 Tax=Tagetes erecta TaxID=13708 RepID=A0AAD8KLW3_TARER|nr:hypothetical protein QVD17_24756 [Tagetes erecta]